NLKPHRFSNFIRAIRNAICVVRFASKKKVAKPAGGIKMTASGADAFGSDKHSRADVHALSDRIAQRDIDNFPAADEAASKIAHGRDARLDSRTCMRRGKDPLLRDVHIAFVQSPLAAMTRNI